ncbi:M56 family metallopeptidase [Flavobacterium sp. EDS]|uniref:M56 family metallopeptidase n=1 Tax=Flavobacterium sp. EDS TaxID=2897328 RepID=UPI001E32ACEC|nr:M56 family metallopeptidase [Flavobacterium sp. EDS]MCD0474080.1 M56 family metallopeptidase [Flavobacterium sp. EDS]
MEAIFIYILKTSGLITLFYLAYYFLLRKETFFNSNRWFLLTGLITSVVLPFIVYTKTVWIASTPTSYINNYQIYTPQNNPDVSLVDWNFALIAIYGIGFLALLIKFAFDFYSLNSVLKGQKIKQQADFKFIDIKENIAPFSYFDYIVYNSSLYSDLELKSIIEHEKVHSEQNHTIDVLVSRIFCILFWFNPIVWLYKKSILQNLEFIADSEAAQKISDKKAYQYTLLKITTHENCVAITNHFFQSLIKKRIIMLNKNQSKKRNSWKYYVVIPALVAFVLLFQVEIIAKEKESIKNETLKTDPIEEITDVDIYKIKNSATDQELKVMAEKLKQNHNIDAVFSDLERNSENLLKAIRIEVKRGSELNQTFLLNESKAIKNCGIIVTTYKNGSKKVAFTTDKKVEDKKRAKELKNEPKNNKSSSVFTTTSTTTSDNNVAITINNDDKDAHDIAIQLKNDENANSSSFTSIKINKNANSTKANTDTKTETTIKISSPKKGNSKKSEQLIIIDGIIVSDISLDELDSKNIKSMSVYKGPDAIAKYGTQGENGVIEIVTKK